VHSQNAGPVEKATIRAHVRERLKQIPAAGWAERSSAAVERLLQQSVWHEAKTVLAYRALKDELDLSHALARGQAQGKLLALPRYVAAENAYCAALFDDQVNLARGAFGVHEPGPDAEVLPLNRLDVVLVPGVAFDACGRRLGRGRGFYDRLLAQVRGIKCGVALDEQIVEELPAEPHDIAMDYILTPTRWLTMHRAPGARS
jgi:5-formyltetrahydrofolate cyclo-ligase